MKINGSLSAKIENGFLYVSSVDGRVVTPEMFVGNLCWLDKGEAIVENRPNLKKFLFITISDKKKTQKVYTVIINIAGTVFTIAHDYEHQRDLLFNNIKNELEEHERKIKSEAHKIVAKEIREGIEKARKSD